MQLQQIMERDVAGLSNKYANYSIIALNHEVQKVLLKLHTRDEKQQHAAHSLFPKENKIDPHDLASLAFTVHQCLEDLQRPSRENDDANDWNHLSRETQEAINEEINKKIKDDSRFFVATHKLETKKDYREKLFHDWMHAVRKNTFQYLAHINTTLLSTFESKFPHQDISNIYDQLVNENIATALKKGEANHLTESTEAEKINYAPTGFRKEY